MKQLLFAASTLALAAALAPAQAADKGAPANLFATNDAPAIARSWTGCGGGIGASYVTASVDFGAPIDFSSSGAKMDVQVNCDVQAGPLVGGIFANYGRLFGDIKTLGVDSEWQAGARIGVLPNKSTLIYGHAEYVRANVSGLGNVDGWGFGPGMEVKIADTPWSIDLRGTYTTFDISNFAPPGVKANDFEAGVHFNYKFSGH